MQSQVLKATLEAGFTLAGSTRSEGVIDLRSILVSRLNQYYHVLGQDPPVDKDLVLEEVQLITAHEALCVIQKVQNLLSGRVNETQSPLGTSTTQPQEELIGTRDLAQLRTLFSISCKWGVQPLLARVCAAIPTISTARHQDGSSIIDLTNVPNDFAQLSQMTQTIVNAILPEGPGGPLNQTHLTAMFLDRNLVDILRPSIVLGWLPKSLSSDSVHPVDDLRPKVMRLISVVSASQSITALSVIRSDSTLPIYARKSCIYLLGRQILRREGVRGLFTALFSDEDPSGDDAPLAKLEQVAKLLQTLPVGLKEEIYFRTVIHQLLGILSMEGKTVPPAHQRAAAFSLTRLLAEEEDLHHALVTRILFPILQHPFLLVTNTALDMLSSDSSLPEKMSPNEALATLQTLLINTDPSPLLISRLLTPIAPSLYAIAEKLEEVKTSDPTTKETLRGILGTWGRLVGAAEGAATLWLIVNGEGGEWKVDIAGELSRVENAGTPSSLALFTPEDLKRAKDSGELDIDSNIMNLRPTPLHFVHFMKSLDRPDVVSDVFVRLLEAYREGKNAADSDPLKTLLYLQIIVQIQSQSSSGDTSLNILKKPDHILSFVKHVLEMANVTPPAQKSVAAPKLGGLSVADLRIVEGEPEENMNDSEGDSDDESPWERVVADDGEIISTALNLLLSILEANPDLSIQTAPILDDIFSLLEKIAKEATEDIKALAREARMVLIARLASSFAPTTAKARSNKDEETSQDTYQKALKLLQDPILPVRAHGLLLLRQLVSARPSKSGSLQEPSVNRALVPAILSVFLQSLQDDDSYIFLNAVQGLAAMVDGFGREVLKGLVDMYVKGADGIGSTIMTQQDLETRTRIGEALGQVIRRCGDALPNYANVLIPSLSGIIRLQHLPIALRTSAISLLAQCANTSSFAILPYAIELMATMTDILQLESVQAVEQKGRKTQDPSQDPQEKGDLVKKKDKQDAVEFQPTSSNTKIPLLRRASLHFLTLLVRAFSAQLDGLGNATIRVLPADIMRRTRITAGYVASTDEDSVVRVMAREVVDALQELAEAMLGI